MTMSRSIAALAVGLALIACLAVAQQPAPVAQNPALVVEKKVPAPLQPPSPEAATAIKSIEIVNSIGMRLVRIPAGAFLMGCEEPIERLLRAFPAHNNYTPDYWNEEYPSHRVRITRPFFLGKFEVTVGQYRRFVEDTSYKTEPETDGR